MIGYKLHVLISIYRHFYGAHLCIKKTFLISKVLKYITVLYFKVFFGEVTD